MIPSTHLQTYAVYRLPASPIRFYIGELGFINAAIKASNGDYTITGATFQLLYAEAPVAPPNGTVDYTNPVAVADVSSGAGPLVQASHLFNGTELRKGTYQAKFTIQTQDSDGNNGTFILIETVVMA